MAITLAQLHTFHTVERKIFSQLVLHLRREPSEALLLLSLWMYLEKIGYHGLVSKLMELTTTMLDALAEEGALCLRCLGSKVSTSCGGSLLLTTRLAEKEISLRLLNKSKHTTIAGVKYFLNMVCARIFIDILTQVLPTPSPSNSNNRLSIPGFPHPTFGGPLEVLVLPLDSVILCEEDTSCWRRRTSLIEEAPEEDRTLFLTFSNGYRVSKEEVRELITRAYGDCVVSITMDNHLKNKGYCDQALYAIVVLRSVADIDRILDGDEVINFKIKGKHVRARKFYERKEHKYYKK